jgi:hypothetical protein
MWAVQSNSDLAVALVYKKYKSERFLNFKKRSNVVLVVTDLNKAASYAPTAADAIRPTGTAVAVSLSPAAHAANARTGLPTSPHV